MTKVTDRIRCSPEFVQDRESKDDGLTVLAEWGTRKFFDMHGNAWPGGVGIHRIADRAAKENIRL